MDDSKLPAARALGTTPIPSRHERMVPPELVPIHEKKRASESSPLPAKKSRSDMELAARSDTIQILDPVRSFTALTEAPFFDPENSGGSNDSAEVRLPMVLPILVPLVDLQPSSSPNPFPCRIRPLPRRSNSRRFGTSKKM